MCEIYITRKGENKIVHEDEYYLQLKPTNKNSVLNTYKYDEYVVEFDNENTNKSFSDRLRKMILEKGVAIIPNVLTKEECENMVSGMWDYLETITREWQVPITRDNKSSWKSFPDLFALHSMLIQHHKIGHAQFLWDLRQNPKVVNVFMKLWKTDDVLTSFDGASIHLPPEDTGRGWYRGTDSKKDGNNEYNYRRGSWLHTDQSYLNSNFNCVQSWVTGLDVNEGDATLLFLEGSNRYHEKASKRFDIKSRFEDGEKNLKNDWHKLNEDEFQFYKDKGCELRRIKCPKGSIVLWDSRCIHSGQESMKIRKNPNIRCVGYVCMLPRYMVTDKDLKKKRKIFEEMRTTTCNPVKPKMFAKVPRTYGRETQKISDIEKPKLTKLGKQIAGLT